MSGGKVEVMKVKGSSVFAAPSEIANILKVDVGTVYDLIRQRGSHPSMIDEKSDIVLYDVETLIKALDTYKASHPHKSEQLAKGLPALKATFKKYRGSLGLTESVASKIVDSMSVPPSILGGIMEIQIDKMPFDFNVGYMHPVVNLTKSDIQNVASCFGFADETNKECSDRCDLFQQCCAARFHILNKVALDTEDPEIEEYRNQVIQDLRNQAV